MVTKIIKKGNLLLAKPLMSGDSFSRSVVFLTEHNQEGSIGFILNQPIQLWLSDLFEEIDNEIPIYSGGPVGVNNLYFIHKKPDLIEGSHEVIEDIYWGGNFGQVKSYLNKGYLSDNEIRFFIGYSGWGERQLENELYNRYWVMMEEEGLNLFEKHKKNFWSHQMKRLGGEHLLWANAPINPSLN